MLAAIITSIILVGMTLMIHYEILRIASAMLPTLPIPVRMRVIFVMFAAFLAHTIEVWLYALAFYIYIDILHLGAFGGEMMGDWRDFVYYSAVTYTSLGLGDVFPLGGARLSGAGAARRGG